LDNLILAESFKLTYHNNNGHFQVEHDFVKLKRKVVINCFYIVSESHRF